MATEFTGVVLAGGRSRRMGRDKASLPWGETSLLDRMVALLHEAGAGRVFVSGRPERRDGLADTAPDRGPVGGIASVLPHCADGLVVIVPVDMPTLRIGRVHALLAAAGPARSAAFAGHPLPCALRIDAQTRAAVESIMRDQPDGPAMHGFLDDLGVIHVPIEGRADDLRPCNTPADWAALNA